MRLGIYGGSFNPPHIGHLRSAKAASLQLGLDLLVVVPVGVPPHKSLPDDAPSAQTRLMMAKAAFVGVENTVVSDIEATRTGISYTFETIDTIRRDYPDADLFLLMGTDMFITLEDWKESEAILKNVTPAVFSRGQDDLKKIAGYSLSIKKRCGAVTETVINDVVEISSSNLRDMLPKREGAEFIPEETYLYIIRNGIYGAKPAWEWLRTRAYSMLDPHRIAHVAGCEQEALRLARKWGVDAEEAREAAILHDITKNLSLNENMAVLDRYGVKIEQLMPGEEKLLHSKTGSLIAAFEFGASQNVAEAIKWHTTGKANMTKLEKIIYLADYIEPVRDFEGIDKLRELSYENLDAAVKTGIEISVADMKSRGITPNRITIDALESL